MSVVSLGDAMVWLGDVFLSVVLLVGIGELLCIGNMLVIHLGDITCRGGVLASCWP